MVEKLAGGWASRTVVLKVGLKVVLKVAWMGLMLVEKRDLGYR